MPLISRRDLRRFPVDVRTKTASINEERNAPVTTAFDVFLSHSYRDARALTQDELFQLKKLIESWGLKVYVDWIVDPHLDRSRVTAENAQCLRNRMTRSRSLLYATTQTSSTSKWMPWELGYVDGKTSRAAILPVIDQSGDGYAGQEYLGIYPHVTKLPSQSGRETLYVIFDKRRYLELSEWIGGVSTPRTATHSFW
jgi:hypothetical protein